MKIAVTFLQRHVLLVSLLLLVGLTACTTPANDSPPAVPSPSTVAVAGITAVSSAYPAPPTPIASATTIILTPEQSTQPSPSTPTYTVPPTVLTPTPTPAVSHDLALKPEDIFLFPVPNIYAGEKVTFQINAQVPENVNPEDVSVHILVDYQDVVSGTLNAVNLQGNAMGIFEWAWDTTDQSGDHLIHIILDRYDTIHTGDENRENNQAAIPVTIYEPSRLSRQEREAVWINTETDCCILHVVSGTAAERDLRELMLAVETAVQQAAARLDEQPARKFDVYLIDRVIGQGGYAGYAIVVSYLDRSYANNGFHQVMTHEAVHLLDRQFAPERITFLAEGIAVWASDGHYKPEDIEQRAAALITIGEYIPLSDLIDNFYPVQHEIGYLEAAGFVSFLIDNFGWSRFRDFYADVNAQDAYPLSEALNLNLQQHFNITLDEAEAQWLAHLQSLPEDPNTVADLQTTIRYYNVMRRYQQLYDPTAYFLTAWLPYPEASQKEGNPADLTRHPDAEINITLELMLFAADRARHEGNQHQANILLDSVMRVLENDGSFVDPLARSYLSVTQTAKAAGYEAQQLYLNGNRATLMATKENSTQLFKIDAILSDQTWVLLD